MVIDMAVLNSLTNDDLLRLNILLFGLEKAGYKTIDDLTVVLIQLFQPVQHQAKSWGAVDVSVRASKRTQSRKVSVRRVR